MDEAAFEAWEEGGGKGVSWLVKAVLQDYDPLARRKFARPVDRKQVEINTGWSREHQATQEYLAELARDRERAARATEEDERRKAAEWQAHLAATRAHLHALPPAGAAP